MRAASHMFSPAFGGASGIPRKQDFQGTHMGPKGAPNRCGPDCLLRCPAGIRPAG
jgi:hypothetical protein